MRVVDSRSLRILWIRKSFGKGVLYRGVSQYTVHLYFDRGVRHKVEMVPGIIYCVTLQCIIPKGQCDVIDN